MALKVLRSIPGSAVVVKSVTNLQGASQERPMGQHTATNGTKLHGTHHHNSDGIAKLFCMRLAAMRSDFSLEL